MEDMIWAANPWAEALLAKFPQFDPSWNDEIKLKWFDAFDRFVKGQTTMKKPRLFEYAVLYHPKLTKDEREMDQRPKSELLIAITPVLALDEKEVGMIASRAIPASHADRLEDVEIMIRPS